METDSCWAIDGGSGLGRNDSMKMSFDWFNRQQVPEVDFQSSDDGSGKTDELVLAVQAALSEVLYFSH